MKKVIEPLAVAGPISDGFPNALTPADLAAMTPLNTADFQRLAAYGVPRRIGQTNIGTLSAPVYEDRFEMIIFLVNPTTMTSDLRQFQNARPAAYRIDYTLAAFSAISGATVTVNFGAANATIAWGDGVQESYAGGSGNKSHTYAAGGNPASYQANIVFTNPATLTTITITGGLNSFDSSLQSLVSLTTLILTGGNLTNWPGLPPNLTTLDLSNQKLTSVSGLPWVLQTLKLDNNPLAYFESPGNLVTNTMQRSHIVNAFQLSPSLTNLDCSGGIFSVAAVNSFLQQLDANGKTGGIAKFQTQTPIAPPSGTGATAKTNLIAKGWTITTD